jgi:hypothetical protein
MNESGVRENDRPLPYRPALEGEKIEMCEDRNAPGDQVRGRGEPRLTLREKGAKLARKWGQLQPCIHLAVFSQECTDQLASCGPT